MAAKKKRLTQAEKKRNAEAKKRLQEQGLLPPDKPRLNRRKFVDEAMREWNNRLCSYTWEVYLVAAFKYILAGHVVGSSRELQEAVGAAKVLKLAIRLHEFDMKLVAEGRKEYKLSEQLEYIKDILDA